MRFQDRKLLIKFAWINASTQGVLAEIAAAEEKEADRDDEDDCEEWFDQHFLLDFFLDSSCHEL